MLTEQQKEQILSEIPDDQKDIIREILKRDGGHGVLYHPPIKAKKRCDEEEEGKSVFTAISECTDAQRLKLCDPSKITKEGKLKCSGITVEEIKQKMKEREEAIARVQEQQTAIDILVKHGREQETKMKEQSECIDSLAQLLAEQQRKFEEHVRLSEERMNKLASLILTT